MITETNQKEKGDGDWGGGKKRSTILCYTWRRQNQMPTAQQPHGGIIIITSLTVFKTIGAGCYLPGMLIHKTGRITLEAGTFFKSSTFPIRTLSFICIQSHSRGRG